MALEIPLFPLRTVLFPGMPLPLRIFEERYLVMMRELENSASPLGVLLIKQGQETGGGTVPFDVGTTAAVEETEEVEGGRLVVLCRGLRRFRLIRMLPPEPYPRGEIEYIEDQAARPEEDVGEPLSRVRKSFPEYFQLAQALTDQWARPFSLPSEPHALVNLLGPWLKAEEREKQDLLELRGAAERVTRLADLLDDLIGRVRPEVEQHRRRRYGGLGGRN